MGTTSMAWRLRDTLMERFLPRIWVFVMAFGLGISVSAIWRIYALPATPEPVIDTTAETNAAVMEAPNADAAADGPKLLEGSHTCGASAEGQVYYYDDGGWVRPSCRRFKSSTAATRELVNRLRGTTIEYGSPLMDGNGNQIGEQILITTPQIVRIRKKGRLLCEVEASSLYHLTWFEKQR